MSTSYEIACKDCKVGIWIGQSQHTNPPFCLYYGERETMEKLRLFLWNHVGHSLIMDDSQTLECEGILREENQND